MKHYIDENGQIFAYEADGSQDHLIGDKVAMTAEEVEAHINPPKTAEEIIATFKSMYLATVGAKLKQLDYDSLATVELWKDDADYSVEATRILTWYKNIIKMNYELLNNVSQGLSPMPTEIEYQSMIDRVVF